MDIPILSVKEVGFSYSRGKGEKFKVLENVSFDVRDREFVSIVGPSGCGKSTLLRIIAGILKPEKGYILLEGKPVLEPTPRITMVFQQFALFPWMTAVENVEVALLDLVKDKEARREIASRMLSMVGLEGFEDAYPRELSGSMKRRVSLARALASNPDVLLMDEPFSALDELTAESLRNEILRMLSDPTVPLRVVVLVTHNIDEAVKLSNRVIILSRRPARVLTEISIDLPHPRNPRSLEFEEYVDKIFKYLS